MNTAALFVEAIDALTVLLRAAATWFVLMGVAATLALHAVAVAVWAVCRAVSKAARRAVGGPVAAEAVPEAPAVTHTRTRSPTPAWAADTDTDDYETKEAA